MQNPIRLAVVGARRGHAHASTAQFLDNRIQLVAVCDTNPALLAEWRDKPGVRCFDAYEQLLADPEIDAVCIATPLLMHARQSIQALEAGKHVLCEVTAAWTLEECHALVAAAERSDRTYMMAENCCFYREVLMVGEMVRRGVFGELISAEGSYLHDCCDLYFNNAETLAWRGELRHASPRNWYPTHSLGPVCKWLGINETDTFKTTATWGSGSKAVAAYARRNFGAESPFAKSSFWVMPDLCHTLIRTGKGVLIEHRLDAASPRPRPQNRYALQGTNASFVSNPDSDADPLIWIRGSSPASQTGTAEEWESLWKYADEYEHPLWREYGEVALKCGHDGADFFVLREFAAALIENRRPYVDVYDAVAWSCISPLSEDSIRQGNASVEVPLFKAN